MTAARGDLTERIARRLSDWRLVTPALAFLHVHLPLAFVSSQALLVLQPLLETLAPRATTAEWIALVGDRQRLTQLLGRLESESEGRRPS